MMGFYIFRPSKQFLWGTASIDNKVVELGKVPPAIFGGCAWWPNTLATRHRLGAELSCDDLTNFPSRVVCFLLVLGYLP